MRDVIVVGSGGGGPVIAKELAARGLDVLVLEAGPRFADPETEWSHLERDANQFTTGYFRVGPADRSRAIYRRDYDKKPGRMFNISGVGGTTLHYFGNNPRAYQGVFTGYAGPDKSLYENANPFPFRYADLLPYYEWVEATLPVQTAAMGRKEQRWLEACERLGLSYLDRKDVPAGSWYRPQENAVLQPGGVAGKVKDPEYPAATGCTFCGHCWQGCRAPHKAPRNLKARRSTDNSYVPMMLTADTWARGGRAATLVTGAFVTRIRTRTVAGSVVASGVEWRTADGSRASEDAKVVVLAAGVIESPRLYLNSGLPNQNGWVGKGMTDHHPDLVIGVLDDDIGAMRGPGSATRIDLPGYGCLQQTQLGPAMQAFSFAFSDSGFAGYPQFPPKVSPMGADIVGSPIGNDMRSLIEHGENLLISLVLTDDDSEKRFGVSRGGFTDENGWIPKIVMDGRNRSARTKRNRDYLAKTSADLMRAAGANRVIRIDMAPIIFHPHSSMRMGASAQDSVCTPDGQTRGVKGLFVADNSVLSNALGGPNPTLTTQALGTRTAENIFKSFFGGDPWVAREEPVTSIDDRVTAAVVARGL